MFCLGPHNQNIVFQTKGHVTLQPYLSTITNHIQSTYNNCQLLLLVEVVAINEKEALVWYNLSIDLMRWLTQIFHHRRITQLCKGEKHVKKMLYIIAYFATHFDYFTCS